MKLFPTYFLILIFFFFFSEKSIGQSNDLKIGEWKSHLPFTEMSYCTQSEEKVYFSANVSILSVDKEEHSIEFFSKIDGLSDVETGRIKYDVFNEALIITYLNGNIDLLTNEGIINMPSILNSSLTGDLAIRDIYIESETKAYLAIGSIFKEMNVRDREFGDETQFDITINSITEKEGIVYVSTDDGIYWIDNNSNINIQDFSNWNYLDVDQGFPPFYKSKAIVHYENKLYMDVNDTLFSYSNGILDSLYHESFTSIKFLTAENEHLLLGLGCCNPSMNCDCISCFNDNCVGKVLYYDDQGNYTESAPDCVVRTEYAIEDEVGNVWFSDRYPGLRMEDASDHLCRKMNFNTPFGYTINEILIDEGNLWLTTEVPRLGNFNAVRNLDGFYSLIDGKWSYYNQRNVQEYWNDQTRDFYKVAIHPENKKVYVGTLWSGLIEYDGDTHKLYNNEAPSLLDFYADGYTIRVTGLAFDDQNNLWMANHAAPNPIVVLKDDGTWLNDFPVSQKSIRNVTIDHFGNKWFVVDGSSFGLLVFDEGENIENSEDDQSRLISINNSVLETNKVNTIEIDLDGNVWVGTEEGAYVFECGANVFDSNCQGSRRIVQVGGVNAHLLESENITTIAVDGANRKWFGTTNGIFVQSPNGEEAIAHFNVDNSPLFSNGITDISIDHTSGEVFIATGRGLISLGGEAQEGGAVHDSNVFAYPNPVRPDYEGPIAITGLARDSNVKITDVNGQLIYETKALGGQAIWDGRDFSGRKASSGVYLVFGSTDPRKNVSDPKGIVTKILMIKQ